MVVYSPVGFWSKFAININVIQFGKYSMYVTAARVGLQVVPVKQSQLSVATALTSLSKNNNTGIQ